MTTRRLLIAARDTEQLEPLLPDEGDRLIGDFGEGWTLDLLDPDSPIRLTDPEFSLINADSAEGVRTHQIPVALVGAAAGDALAVRVGLDS